MRPIPHSKELPVLKPPDNVTKNKDDSNDDKVHPYQVGETCKGLIFTVFLLYVLLVLILDVTV